MAEEQPQAFCKRRSGSLRPAPGQPATTVVSVWEGPLEQALGWALIDVLANGGFAVVHNEQFAKPHWIMFSGFPGASESGSGPQAIVSLITEEDWNERSL